MSNVKSEDFKENDRVELSGYFDVHAHGNGFQLRREDRTYSIIPVDGRLSNFKWEVNKSKNTFDELHDAIEYVLDEENISVKVETVKEYYGMEEVEEK